MSKDCGISEAAGAVNDQVNDAKSQVDSLIADADKGIANSISGLKDKISGLTDGIKAKFDTMAPEIPKPAGSLQESITGILESSNDPGTMVQKFKTLKEQFGGRVDLGSVLSTIGLDEKKFESLDKQLGEAIQGGSDKIQELSQKVASGIPGGEALSSKASNLIQIAQGNTAAIGSLVGGFNLTAPGFDPNSALDNVCTKVPNVEIDAKGNTVKKGVETKAPVEDAPVPVEPAKVKEVEQIKPETKQPNEALIEKKEGEVEFAYTQEYIKAIKPYSKKYEERMKELTKEYKKDLVPKFKDLKKRKKAGESPLPANEVYYVKSMAKYIDWAKIAYIHEKYINAHNAGVAINPTDKKIYVDSPFGVTQDILDDKVRDAQVQAKVKALPYFVIYGSQEELLQAVQADSDAIANRG